MLSIQQHQQQSRTSFMQSPLVIWLKTILDDNSCNSYNDLCQGIYLNKAWLQIDQNPLYSLQDSLTTTTTQSTISINHELLLVKDRIKNLNILLQNVQNFYKNILEQLLVIRLPDVTRIALQYSSTNNINNNQINNNCLQQQQQQQQQQQKNNLLEDINNSHDSLLLSSLASSITSSSSLHHSDDNILSLLFNHTGYNNSTIIDNQSSSSSLSWLNQSTNYDDLQVLILLILGCAVQCEHKELFIEKIKQLDISIQHSIVECIQYITDNPESVFLCSEWSLPPEDLQEKDRLYIAFVKLIKRLTCERNELYQRVIDLTCEVLQLTLQINQITNDHHQNHQQQSSLFNNNNNCSNNNQSSMIVNCDQKSHYLVELADCKSKLRRLQQELEEKNEIIIELKEIIEQNKEFYTKLKHDNLELTQEARTAKAYRDEIDVLNERCRKIDRLESEIQKYREKINELDYCKTRIEELRDDNQILTETKTMLEDQLELSRKRMEKIPELEEKLLKLTTTNNELSLQCELDKNQIERLLDEIEHLRVDKKSTNDELKRVQQELNDLQQQIRLSNEMIIEKNTLQNGGLSLLDQINQDTSKRLLKLEHENKKQQSIIENYQNNYIEIDAVMKFFTNLDIISLNNHNSDQSTNINDDDDSLANVGKSKIEKLSQIKQWLSNINMNFVHSKSMEQEKLQSEKENIEYRQQLNELQAKYDSLDKSNQQLNQDLQKQQRLLESKVKKLVEYESEMQSIRSENEKLINNIDSLRLSLKKMNNIEIEISNLETDKQRLQQTNKSLEKEINRLKQSLETKDELLDDQTAKLSDYDRQIAQMTKDIEQHSHVQSKLKELEKENKDLQNNANVQRITLITLQKELIDEKLKIEKFSDEFAKIIDTLKQLSDNENDNIDGDDIQTLINDSINNGQISLKIDEIIRTLIDKYSYEKDKQITELNQRLSDLKNNNEEMQNLINSLRKQLNLDDTNDIHKSIDYSLNEFRQNIMKLENENEQLRQQLQMKNDLAEMETKLSTIISELKKQQAKLEVENSLLKSQNSLLENQTIELQEQMVQIQDSIEKLKLKCDEYETAHRLLINDNESLQEIHQQLTVDYENLTKIHGQLKQSYKKLKYENKTMEERLNSQIKNYEELLAANEKELKQLRQEIETHNCNVNNDNNTDINMNDKQSNDATNNEEYEQLNDEYKRLKNEHKMLQNIYKKLRTDNNDLKLKHTELQGETNDCKDRMNILNVEVSKLSNYCEMVAMINQTLEYQRRNLSIQTNNLLKQYNDLLIELCYNNNSNTSPTSATNLMNNYNDSVIKDKLNDLIMKKERLEKMFKEYDLSFEKNWSRVSNNDNCKSNSDMNVTENSAVFKQSNKYRIVDDSIYGLLWESESPSMTMNQQQSMKSLNSNKFPLDNSGKLNSSSSTSLLKQYSINNEKDRKLLASHSSASLPRIPPRNSPMRYPIPASNNSVEISPVENKMSINISSSRYSNNQQQQQTSNNSKHTYNDNTSFSKLHITSTQPFTVARSISTISSTTIPSSSVNNGPNNSNNYFMRGSFKSNSVNYGNLMRKNSDHSTATANYPSKILHNQSPPINNNKHNYLVQSQQQSIIRSVRSTNQQRINPMSPLSFHSDNSSSSSTSATSTPTIPLVNHNHSTNPSDSIIIDRDNLQLCNNISGGNNSILIKNISSNQNISNTNAATNNNIRSRITITNDSTSIQSLSSSSNSGLQLTNNDNNGNNNNISIQIMNNNSNPNSTMTETVVTTVTNPEQTSSSSLTPAASTTTTSLSTNTNKNEISSIDHHQQQQQDQSSNNNNNNNGSNSIWYEYGCV